MSEKIFDAKIALLNKTTEEWAAETNIPIKGCPCIEWVDSYPKMKIGDGIHVYKDLAYLTDDLAPGFIIAALGYTPADNAKLGIAEGIATLDGNGKVPSGQLPSFVDDVIEIDSINVAPETGEKGKIYIAIDTGKCYRWGGTKYVEIITSDMVTPSEKNGYIKINGTDVKVYEPIQADWNETNTSSLAFIKNKPNVPKETVIDDGFSVTSENPVQNKVITKAINTSNQNINTLKSRIQAVEDGLDPDISADFLTSEGFGNLRYYNGHFQKYDKENSTWIDTAATPENVYVLNMQPQSMKMIRGAFDYKVGLNKLKFLEPDDIILDNQLICVIDKVIIRRKLNSYPTDEKDGEFVVEIKRSDFGLYNTNWFYDNSCTPNIDEIWCYKAFPVSTTGFINNSSLNETKIKYVDIGKVSIYGFEINQAESDPASMITYLEDCANAYFDPAYMDYENGTFNYGSWDDAWFIRDIKPVVLNYDGSVKYELDPNDYTKKKDGTNSNIDSDDLNGYVMIGIPKVYYKCENVSEDVVRYYFCSEQLDDSYVCWSHINAVGNEIDYCYISAYSVNYDGTNIKCRSGLNRSGGIQYSQIISTMDSSLNSGAHIWDGFVFSDYCLLTLLLMLIGKSTDTQTTFGKGAGGTHHQNGSENKKGIFYGDDTNTNLKTFGIEHLWGDGDIVTVGSITKNGTFHSKMVYGTQDGSLGNGYNADGEGYIINTDFTAPNASGYYIDKFYFTDKGIFPKSVGGSSTTYFCDGYYGAAEKGMFMFGFNYANQTTCGMFSNGYHITNGSDGYTMFKLSCKPL